MSYWNFWEKLFLVNLHIQVLLPVLHQSLFQNLSAFLKKWRSFHQLKIFTPAKSLITLTNSLFSFFLVGGRHFTIKVLFNA